MTDQNQNEDDGERKPRMPIGRFRKLLLTAVILVAMICWSAMAIAGVDDGKLGSFSGAVFAICLLYVFLPGLTE